MSKIVQRQRVFRGLRQDISPEDLGAEDSPLCQDIILTPMGSLSTPQGSVKNNTSAYNGQVVGIFGYRSAKANMVIYAVSDGTVNY
jgi:hypothetical protein